MVNGDNGDNEGSGLEQARRTAAFIPQAPVVQVVQVVQVLQVFRRVMDVLLGHDISSNCYYF